MFENIKKYQIVFGVIFFIVFFINPMINALIMGMVAIYISREALRFLDNINKIGIKGKGTIVEYRRNRSRHQVPIIQFTAANGELIIQEPTVHSSTDLSIISNYEDSINKTVPIVYNPDNPTEFIIDGEDNMSYAVMYLTIVVGLLLVVLGILGLFGIIKVF